MEESFAYELGRCLAKGAGFDKSGVLGQALGTVGRTALRSTSGMSLGLGNAIGSGGLGQGLQHGLAPRTKSMAPKMKNVFAQSGTQLWQTANR
jgi:hypothetical protein